MISRKLRSRAGASLIAALFLFLLCAMAGSTILAAATANAGRIANRRTENQNYYKTISAARLFADQFSKQKITVELTLDYATGYDPNPNVTAKTGGKFAEFLIGAATDIFKQSLSTDADKNWSEDFGAFSLAPDPKNFEVFLSGKEDDENLKVHGRISLQCVGGYLEMQAVFSSGAVSDAQSYRVYLKSLAGRDVQSDVVTNEVGDITGEKKTITFTWSDIKVKES